MPSSGYLDRPASLACGRPELMVGVAEADSYSSRRVFPTMGSACVASASRDRFESAPSAIVDDVFAKRAFGDAHPVGRR